jgi:Ribonuclease G/E
MLKGILAIAGQPGLYKVISEGKNNVVIESLVTGKKSTAYADAKMSTLEDIAIYTLQEDMPLKKVLRKIFDKENGGLAISVKSSPEELKKYFAEILPEYDKERVYGSDVKKVISWYNLLNEKGLLIFEDETTAEPAPDAESVNEDIQE